MTEEKERTANSRFAKARVSCFYDSEVLNSSFMHLMKFSAENPRLRKAAKRWQKILTSVVGKSLVVFELNKEIEETVSILTRKNLKRLSQDGSTLFEIILWNFENYLRFSELVIRSKCLNNLLLIKL